MRVNLGIPSLASLAIAMAASPAGAQTVISRTCALFTARAAIESRQYIFQFVARRFFVCGVSHSAKASIPAR